MLIEKSNEQVERAVGKKGIPKNLFKQRTYLIVINGKDSRADLPVQLTTQRLT